VRSSHDEQTIEATRKLEDNEDSDAPLPNSSSQNSSQDCSKANTISTTEADIKKSRQSASLSPDPKGLKRAMENHDSTSITGTKRRKTIDDDAGKNSTIGRGTQADKQQPCVELGQTEGMECLYERLEMLSDELGVLREHNVKQDLEIIILKA